MTKQSFIVTVEVGPEAGITPAEAAEQIADALIDSLNIDTYDTDSIEVKSTTVPDSKSAS